MSATKQDCKQNPIVKQETMDDYYIQNLGTATLVKKTLTENPEEIDNTKVNVSELQTQDATINSNYNQNTICIDTFSNNLPTQLTHQRCKNAERCFLQMARDPNSTTHTVLPCGKMLADRCLDYLLNRNPDKM